MRSRMVLVSKYLFPWIESSATLCRSPRVTWYWISDWPLPSTILVEKSTLASK